MPSGRIVFASAVMVLLPWLPGACSSSESATPLDGGDDGATEAASDAPADTGADANAATCPRTSSEGYSPTFHPPNATQAVCTTAQLDSWVDSCWKNGATPASRDAWVAANGACAACLMNSADAATWGPVVRHPETGFWNANFTGCIAKKTGDASAGSCAVRVRADEACRVYVCRDCKLGSNELTQCLNTSVAANACAAFGPAAAECMKDPAIQACLPSQYPTFVEQFRAYGELFCGAAPDGGAPDAGDAGDAGDASDAADSG